jgi:hypothetical protein
LTAAFFRLDEAFFRFLLTGFFTGISYSCRAEKRRGLYIDGAAMEPLIYPYFEPLQGPLSISCDNRFIGSFLLH